MSTVAKKALASVGKSKNSGYCETFTRSCFGFKARYGSARLAYLASKADGPIHKDMSPPAGVPVFWDITYGANEPYDHVAVSVGGGYCVSTSAGPNRTIARVRISDLTKRWGMIYRGWGEFYHGQRVYTKPKGSRSDTDYPDTKVGTATADLKSAWYRLLGALEYTGDTTTRLQKFLRKSGHYHGRVDGDWGRLTTRAVQRRLADADFYSGLLDGSRGPMTKQAEADYLNAHAWRV